MAADSFETYFRNTFFIERNDLFDKYQNRDISPDYNFEKEKYASPESVFTTIKEAFEDGRAEEVELFFRKLDILAKDKIDSQSKLMKGKYEVEEGKKVFKPFEFVKDGKYARGQNFEEGNNLETDSLQELFENKDGISKIDFKNITHILNSTNPYELYGILNSDITQFNNIRLDKLMDYTGLSDRFEEREREKKNWEILTLQKFYTRGGIVFNQSMIEEVMSDILRYGVVDTLKAYTAPFFTLPKKILYGENSGIDLAKTIWNVAEDSRLRKIIGKEKEYKFEYKNLKKQMRRQFYQSDLSKINEIDKARKNLKVESLEGFIEMIDFSTNDYLKEYNELKSYLKGKNNPKRMKENELIDFYRSIDKIFSEIETDLGKRLSDPSKNYFRNESVINTMMERVLMDKNYIVIDDQDSRWFGLKIPVKNGNVDIETFEKGFKILNTKSKNEILQETKKLLNSKERVCEQILISDEYGGYDVNNSREEIEYFIKETLGFGQVLAEDEIESIINETIEERLQRTKGVVEIGGAKYEFKSRLDVALIKTIENRMNENGIEFIKNFLNERSEIKGAQYVFDYAFEDLFENIKKNPEFHLKGQDINIIKGNRQRISKELRTGKEIPEIVKMFNFTDPKHMVTVLQAFRNGLDLTASDEPVKNNPDVTQTKETKFERMKGKEDEFRPEYSPNFENETPDYSPMRNQTQVTQNKVEKIYEGLEKNSKTIEKLEEKNQEIFTKNFEAVMRGESRINLMNEIEVSKEELENMRFIAQNPEALQKINDLSRRIKGMENRLSSTRAIDRLMEDSALTKKYRDVLQMTDRFYAEIYKSAKTNNYDIILKDYYTAKELMKSTVELDPRLDQKAQREIKNRLDKYSYLKPADKEKVLREVLSVISPEAINKAVEKAEIQKMATTAMNMARKDKGIPAELDTKILHQILKKDIRGFSRLNNEERETVNEFAKKLMKDLKKEKLEDDYAAKEFLEKFNSGDFTDKEFKEYELDEKYSQNSYISELLKDNTDRNEQLKNSQAANENSKKEDKEFATFRKNYQMNEQRKQNITTKAVEENKEIEKFKNHKKNIEKETEEVKKEINNLAVKEVTDENTKEINEDIQNLEKDIEKGMKANSEKIEELLEVKEVKLEKAKKQLEGEEKEDKAEHEQDQKAIEEYEEKIEQSNEEKNKKKQEAREEGGHAR